MNKASEFGEGQVGAHGSLASKVANSARYHRTLWIGVLYAIAIVLVLAVVTKLQ